ncbi:MAG: hypothetical protein H7X99_08400 [Saprospiraceae bacterium]|nr:hypothetical protein [Saprospiraceae bacterium]
MKTLFILLICTISFIGAAQNVSINNDGSLPHETSILDISSDQKGVLLPRLTTIARTSILGPALGLTVFDINTSSYWIYRGDVWGWAELQHHFQNNWESSGINICNKNIGNVGIGIANPTQKLSINGSDPAVDFMNSGTSKGYLKVMGNDMKLGTYFNNSTGNLVFNTKATDRMWIDQNGKVGIGTSEPTSVFTVNGTNPWIEMQNSGVDKGFLQAIGNDLKLGTNSTNTTGNLLFATKLINRMLIDENGKVAIGTSTPASSSILTINDSEPILQLQNNGTNMGFVQLVEDDIKIGTNSSNSDGKFIVRTNAQDRLTVDHTGWVTIKSDNGGIAINADEPAIVFQSNNLTMGSILSDESNGNFVLQKTTLSNGKLVVQTGVTSMYMNESGHINFGTGLAPVGYKVSVEGKVIATDFVALPVASWPDYVFDEAYQLRPLSEVKHFINANKHLPGIPSAAEIEKGGIALGDMSTRLMQKVEELTLYILDLQAQIDNLKKNK